LQHCRHGLGIRGDPDELFALGRKRHDDPGDVQRYRVYGLAAHQPPRGGDHLLIMTMTKCPRCPCPETCLAHATFCQWAAEEPRDEMKIRHIRTRSALARATPADYPSLVTQVGNALGALGRVVGAVVHGEKVTVSEEEQARRMEICRSCEHFDKGRCKLCGCFKNLKTRLATEHCPIEKW
jgi:hypothetical protein